MPRISVLSLLAGIWRYKAGTARANAFVAAVNHTIMTAVANISLDARGEETQLVIVSDLSEAGSLDFNPSIHMQSFEFATAFLRPIPALILVSGASSLTSVLLTAAQAVLSQEARELFTNLRSPEDIEEYVDAEDLPHWWYKQAGQVRADCHDPDDRRNTWRLDDLLGKAWGFTAADIWHPGPWLEGVGRRAPRSECADCRISAALPRARSRRSRLLLRVPSVIEENEDEKDE